MNKSTLGRLWSLIPIWIRAILSGLLVSFLGGMLTIPLLLLNLKYNPQIPWMTVILTLYLWVYWRYFGGRWAPRSTSIHRREYQRAKALPGSIWTWALVSGFTFIFFVVTSNQAIARIVKLDYGLYGPVLELPLFSLVCVLCAVSAVAGVVEETAFRGYMQGPLEKRFGAPVAITMVSFVFLFAHFLDFKSLNSIIRAIFILQASIVYGIIAYHCRSILPTIVIHACGDMIAFSLIVWNIKHPSVNSANLGMEFALSSNSFWLQSFLALLSAVATMIALAKLAKQSRRLRTGNQNLEILNTTSA